MKSPQEPKTIAYVTGYDGYAGGEESLLGLLRHIDRQRFRPVAFVRSRNLLYKKLLEAHIKTYLFEDDQNTSNEVSPSRTVNGVGKINQAQNSGQSENSSQSRFESIFNAEKVDLLHVNCCFSGPSPVMTALKLEIPIIHHVRIFQFSQYSKTLPYSKKIIAVSNDIKQNLVSSEHLPPNDIQVIYNGVDTLQFTPTEKKNSALREKLGLNSDVFLIAMVARIAPSKRQDFFLQMLVEFQDKLPNTHTLFVGPTDNQDQAYLDELKIFVNKHGLQDRVTFWGFEEKVKDIYQAADAVVLCSEREAFGRCVIEAMASQVPIVAPNSGGPAEIIKSEIDGLLYDGQDHQALARGLVRLKSEEGLSQRLVKNANQRVKDFTIEHHAAEVEKVYDEILS